MIKMSDFRTPELGSEQWEEEKGEKERRFQEFEEIENKIKEMRGLWDRLEYGEEKDELFRAIQEVSEERDRAMKAITDGTLEEQVIGAVRAAVEKAEAVIAKIKKIKDKYSR